MMVSVLWARDEEEPIVEYLSYGSSRLAIGG